MITSSSWISKRPHSRSSQSASLPPPSLYGSSHIGRIRRLKTLKLAPRSALRRSSKWLWMKRQYSQNLLIVVKLPSCTSELSQPSFDWPACERMFVHTVHSLLRGRSSSSAGGSSAMVVG